MNVTPKTFRSYLSNHLAGVCDMNKGQVASILGEFDALASVDPVRAFKHCHENYGTGYTSVAIASIQSELEKLASTHEGVETNPVVRVRSHIDKFRANLTKCSCEICDGNGVTKTIDGRGQAAAVKDPAFLPQRTFTHTATAAGKKPVTLELSITV